MGIRNHTKTYFPLVFLLQKITTKKTTMKKLIILLLSILISTTTLFAQKLQDVIYLKNGSIIRGTLIEQVPSVKIKTYDGSIWVFDNNEIDKITSEPSENSTEYNDGNQSVNMEFENTNKTHTRQPLFHYTNLSKGLRMMVDFAYQQRFNQHTCSATSLSVTIGWQINPHLFAGLGLSSQAYIDYWYYGTYQNDPEFYAQMPLYSEIRYDLKPSKVSPYLSMRIGYAFSADEFNDYSGFYINPGIGIRARRFSFALGVDCVKLAEPWYFSEITTQNTYIEKTINWQGSVMFRFTYEWGGRY